MGVEFINSGWFFCLASCCTNSSEHVMELGQWAGLGLGNVQISITITDGKRNSVFQKLT